MTTRSWDARTDGEFTDRAEHLRRLRRLAAIARLMDTAIRIPGTGIRFGADSVLGLVPLVGDGVVTDPRHLLRRIQVVRLLGEQMRNGRAVLLPPGALVPVHLAAHVFRIHQPILRPLCPASVRASP